MGRFICLHTSDNSRREIWIKIDAITAIIDARPIHDWTCIDTYAGARGYCVEETAESVIGLIEQQTNPLDNYVCPVPVPVSWSLSKEEEKND